ncbi:cytochrome P450 315a1, mitochondrial [Vanessa cardui]|uniref:cytochrome P450 315a1, mitochondrial n=1 Tax=Vanessa cardui TaxID=171605 RepID=UPI001F130C93|nr:cytochrome P450 315a1, mitochondrial [Vanessa cardui]
MYRLKRILRCSATRYAVRSVQHSKMPLTIADIPHPKSLPIIGTKLDLILAGSGKKLHEYIDNRHKQLGPIFAERLSGSHTELIFISDPALIKSLFINLEGKYPIHILPDPWVLYEKTYGSHRGLFFMNGEEWLINRRIINKHLLRENADDWIRLSVNKTVEDFIENFKNKTRNGCRIKDMEFELYQLSTNVVINVLLGCNSLSRSRHNEELLTIFTSSVRKIFQTTTKLYALPVNWCQRLNLKVWRDFKECVDLSLFLAKKLAQEMVRHNGQSNGLVKRLMEDNMEEEMITRIVADFIIAAGDTTAYTTLWILFLLSKNDEVVKNIRTQDNFYIKLVVKEAMRLYPVAPFLTRILPQDTTLGKYNLNKGTPIIASIYTSGRNEENFSKPNLFLPFRWNRNDHQKEYLVNHVPSASLPFAMGARSCIGKKIAMVQLTEIVSQIVKNFDIKCTNKENINCITSQVLVPDKPMEFVFTVKDELIK